MVCNRPITEACFDRLKPTYQVGSSDSDTDVQSSPEDDKLIDDKARSTENTSTSLSLNELTESFTGLRIKRTKGKHVTEPQASGRNKGRSSPAVSRAESSDDEEEAYENCEFLNYLRNSSVNFITISYQLIHLQTL